MAATARPPSLAPSQLPPVPSSPTYSYASTANPISHFNLPAPPPPRPAHPVLTPADIEQSQAAYTDLLSSAKAYRQALATLSTAASAFGAALESCARLKEARADAIGPPATTTAPATAATTSAASPDANPSHAFNAKGTCTADGLLAAAGLHHLVANHQQILSEATYRAFEVPLLHELDRWGAAVDDERDAYARAARDEAREIRRLEREGDKMRRRQRRTGVAALRDHLVRLTARLDGLTSLHADHARALLRESQEASARVLDASCSLVRAEVDIFESLARKGWAGGGLEDLLERGTDLLAGDDPTSADDAEAGGIGDRGSGSKLFSILPPKSILPDAASDPSRLLLLGTPEGDVQQQQQQPSQAAPPRADSLVVDGDRYQSLASALYPERPTIPARDSDSVFSSDFSRPRGARPFSPPPQPVRLNPDGLIVDGLSDEEDERGAGDKSQITSATTRTKPLDQTKEGEEEDNTAGAHLNTSGDRDEEADQPWRDEVSPGASVESSQHADRRWSFAEAEVEA